MILIKGLLVLCLFVVIPYFWGLLLVTDQNSTVVKNILCGYALMFAVFQIIAIAFTYLRIRFTILCYAYMLLLILGVILSIFKYGKSVVNQFKGLKSFVHRGNWLWLLVCLLILFQAAVAVVFTHMDLDDSVFVGTATTTLFNDGIYWRDAQVGWVTYGHFPSRYVLAPFPIFLAVCSKLTMFHPAVVAHTIMPGFFIPLSYVAYAQIGRRLFPGDKQNRAVFLGLVALVQMFSYYSVYTQGTFILIRSWQGKAVLAGVFIPAIFALCMRFADEKIEKRFWVTLAVFLFASSMISSMGIMLPPMVVGMFCLIYGVLQRRWHIIWKAALACVPNLIMAIIYVVIR